jgi:hypothetical protein
LDLRKWFLLQKRLNVDELRELITHVPCTSYRCPNVMKVFLAGFQTEFKLTDSSGQPTEALRVMVRAMGAQLCQAIDLPPEERRNFTDTKQRTLDPVFKDRWFIRNISVRLRCDGGATGFYGWAWHMFKTEKNLGLLSKRLTETIAGEKQRPMRYLAVCPPNWKLTDQVYQGLWKWRHDDDRTIWDAYGFPSAERSASGSKAPQPKGEVVSTHGHSEMVSA